MKIYNAVKMDVNEQPLHLLVGLNEDDTKVLIESYKQKSGWLIPQVQALLSKELKLLRNEEGLISPTLVIKELGEGKTDEQRLWWRGLLIYINYAPRGSILGKMNSPQTAQPYTSSLVPLILYTLKRDRKVEYSEWDWDDENMRFFVDKDLLDAVRCDWYTEYSVAELLSFRDEVRTIKTGPKAGTQMASTAVTKKSTIKQLNASPFNNLPRLAQHMLLQVHVAHPSVRVPAMILCPDFSVPEALVTDEIVANAKVVIFEDNPW